MKPYLLLSQEDLFPSPLGMDWFTIAIFVGLIAIVLGMVALICYGFKQCPSDRVIVVYGIGSRRQSFRCVHGGRVFVWPFIQHHQFLDLTPIPIDAKLKDLKDKNNIPVNILSIYTIGISTAAGVMENAAERLLGLDLKQVRLLGQDIIFGQLRAVIATMDIEAINTDRDLLIEKISSGVEAELIKVGLRLINVIIQDVQFKTA